MISVSPGGGEVAQATDNLPAFVAELPVPLQRPTGPYYEEVPARTPAPRHGRSGVDE